MADIELRGTPQAHALARHLKSAGDGELRKELLRRIRGAAKEAIPSVRQSANDRLPRRGGLAEQVAGQKYAVRTSLGSSTKVSIVGQGMKELRDMNAGRLRHPVYGDRSRWVAQGITPGFFSDPIERRAPNIRKAIDQAVGDIARRAIRGI